MLRLPEASCSNNSTVSFLYLLSTVIYTHRSFRLLVTPCVKKGKSYSVLIPILFPLLSISLTSPPSESGRPTFDYPPTQPPTKLHAPPQTTPKTQVAPAMPLLLLSSTKYSMPPRTESACPLAESFLEAVLGPFPLLLQSPSVSPDSVLSHSLASWILTPPTPLLVPSPYICHCPVSFLLLSVPSLSSVPLSLSVPLLTTALNLYHTLCTRHSPHFALFSPFFPHFNLSPVLSTHSSHSRRPPPTLP